MAIVDQSELEAYAASLPEDWVLADKNTHYSFLNAEFYEVDTRVTVAVVPVSIDVMDGKVGLWVVVPASCWATKWANRPFTRDGAIKATRCSLMCGGFCWGPIYKKCAKLYVLHVCNDF